MILAAGRGDRMRPLTDHTPKPLLPVAGKPLIVWHLEHLRDAGFADIVINTGWLGEQIPAFLGNGQTFGVNLHFSNEGWPAYETAGGIATALPLLGDEPFLLVNGDVYCDYPFFHLKQVLLPGDDAHIVLVDNPVHHPNGDFGLQQGRVIEQGQRLTYSGIGVFHPRLFAQITPRRPAKLAPLLCNAIANNTLSGEHASSIWVDVGTPERLSQLEAQLRVS